MDPSIEGWHRARPRWVRMNRGQRMAIGIHMNHGDWRDSQLLCCPAWFMQTSVAIPAFSPAQPPFHSALFICSSEIKHIALVWRLGHLASEEVLLGRTREQCVTSVHKSFLGLMESCGAHPAWSRDGGPKGLWPRDLQRTIVRMPKCSHNRGTFISMGHLRATQRGLVWVWP